MRDVVVLDFKNKYMGSVETISQTQYDDLTTEQRGTFSRALNSYNQYEYHRSKDDSITREDIVEAAAVRTHNHLEAINTNISTIKNIVVVWAVLSVIGATIFAVKLINAMN